MFSDYQFNPLAFQDPIFLNTDYPPIPEFYGQNFNGLFNCFNHACTVISSIANDVLAQEIAYEDPYFTTQVLDISPNDCEICQGKVKTNIVANECFINTAALANTINEVNNRLEDLLEYLEKSLNKFEDVPDLFERVKQSIKRVAYLRKEEPKSTNKEAVDSYEASASRLDLELRDQVSTLQKQIKEAKDNQAKNFENALSYTENAINAFNGAFSALKDKYISMGEFSNLASIRNNFWDSHKNKISKTSDFSIINAETKKNYEIDFVLINLLEEEIDNAIKNQMPIPNYLGILSSIQNRENAFTQFKKMFLSSAEPDIKEIIECVIKILVAAEKENNHQFLNSLTETEQEFAACGYASVAEHYGATIAEFKEIDNKNFQGMETIDHYISEWNALLREFDPQHQLFLKLKGAIEALQLFAIQAAEKVQTLDFDAKSKVNLIFKKLDILSSFMDKKSVLKNSPEIESYIEKLNEFIKIAEKELKGIY